MSQSPKDKRRIPRRYIAIAALLATGVFMYFLLGPTPGKARTLPPRSVVASSHILARDIPRGTETHAPATLSVVPGAADATQNGLAERVRALLNGPKPEVCGMSDFEAALFVLSGVQPDMAAVNVAVATAAAGFVQSDSLQEQALGLYLQAELAQGSANEEGMRQRCGNDENCRSSYRPPMQVRADAAEPLAKLALASSDLNVFAAAVYACSSANMGSCAEVTFDAWARREPDNAVPWLLAANEAMGRKDMTSHAEALLHITSSSRYETRVLSRAPLFQSSAVSSQSPMTQLVTGTSIIGSNASFSIGTYQALLSFCSQAEVADPGRKASCGNLAGKLLDSEQSVIGIPMAVAIGKRIGWDASRLQALTDEKDAILELMADSTLDESPYSCSSIEKNNQWIRDSLGKGERAWARELAAKRGKSYAELAEKYRAPTK